MVVFKNFNKGRLGNQLFFVASTIGIAVKNNTNYYFTEQMGYNGVDYQKIFKKKLPITNEIPEKKYHQEKFSYYDISIDEDIEIDGYFQSEKFFKHCEKIIRDTFEFKDEYSDLVMSKYPFIVNSKSIHIRRGDYLNQNDFHPTYQFDYYKSFIDKFFTGQDKIFIFSDDLEWCKEKFYSDRYVFPSFEIDNDLMCFILLSKSKEILISNSTYSWWAAWLNKNNSKKIYSPNHSKWFGPMYNNLETEDIIPESWLQIEI